MALRVKNISEGFYDATGFHPIRGAKDYREAGGKPKHKPGEAAAAKRAKAALKRKHASQVEGHIRRPSKLSVAELKKKLAKNPKGIIPKNWTKAKVKRLPNGDIQVMLT